MTTRGAVRRRVVGAHVLSSPEISRAGVNGGGLEGVSDLFDQRVFLEIEDIDPSVGGKAA